MVVGGFRWLWVVPSFSDYEPASHASHNASHESHASQGASNHRFNVKNNQLMDIII